MGALSYIPTPPAVDAAWERYRELAAASLNDERLKADRQHQEAMVRAHREWMDAFAAMEARP